MKALLIFLMSTLFLPTLGFSMDESDIPPPPMPAYMKAHNKRIGKVNQSEVKKTKPRPKLSTAEQVPKPAKKVGKFLNEPKVQPKIYEKKQAPTAKENEQSASEVKQEFLQAGDEEVVEEVAEDTAAMAEPVVEEKEEVVEEELAELEDATEKLPLAEQQEEEAVKKVAEVAPTAKPVKRKPASVAKSFKAGINRFAKTCSMHAQPNTESQKVGKVSQGKKLWVDAHNNDWHKVYKKSGAVYISAGCL